MRAAGRRGAGAPPAEARVWIKDALQAVAGAGAPPAEARLGIKDEGDTGVTYLLTVDTLVSLVSLSAMEIVLGIDNVVFIAILTGRLPEGRQAWPDNSAWPWPSAYVSGCSLRFPG